mmetsp:Transcript_19256/g.28733  ORF Transcript_19256/g.28733 Transcript_19256/m.28733 type:complete len:757 (+) Transcript_19256:84-2354(+)
MPPSETDNVTVAAAPALLADEKLPSTNLPMQPNCPTLNECLVKSPSNVKEEDLNGTNNGVMENKDVGAMPPAAAAVEPAAAAATTKDEGNNGSVTQDAIQTTNTNPNSEKITNDTPSASSSPRRRVKKRRSDDFVYADTKKEDKPNSSSTQNNNGAKKPPPPAAKKPTQRKRPQQCPSTDSILIDVPLSVTADLGVALKRTRRKRIKRIQDWVALAPGKKKGDGTNSNSNNKVVEKKKKKSETPQKDKQKCGQGSCSDSDDNDNEEDNEKDITLDYDDDALGKTPKRNQYGSVVDYLEAKYVRGVMIADYDDREQAKIQSKQEEEEVDSEGDNSCYDDEDGFIDDSLMVEDVAGQVMASSTYGLTQIEEEARRRKEERKKESGVDGDTEQPNLEGLGITDEKLDDTQLDEGMESGFDDGFFVNLGDLEMAEGWSGDNVVISPTKKKRTKKRVKAAAAAKDDKPVKKKKKISLPSSPKKKKKADDTKQKTDSKAASPKKGKKTTPSSGKSEEKQPKKKDQVVKQPKKVSPEKERANQLRKLMKRKYNACVKMIKDLSTDQLPLKQRNKKTVKLSVSIPADKNIGDEITFANPNIPGQKLKVQIPAKADMEKRTFVASVPGPKVPFTKKENNLPKEFKEALCDYSTAFDDWCAAEETHNASLPENKRKDYKIKNEKMKKFDEMVSEFPNKLATPIDATYLRAAVRRVRSNKARQEKRKSGTETPKRQTVTEKVEINITVPQKGNEFALVSFNKQDFQE